MSIDKAQSFLVTLTSRSDLTLAAFLGVLVTMMVLPLPTWLIDTIIAFNMTIAVSILMLSIYITSPLQFSSFPTVLLLITLFRLALSISSTRAILLEADAGEIINAFGDFVVGGNLVVGFVIFFIVTIVQFIVITKGAERVAEVGARFSLDAMPGKQMSIDSDLRAGTITMEEARLRRDVLTKESQLFGSMDGAMKFVKGDSIAGIIIIMINMAGGMLVGVFQRGLSASESAGIYSILTIGDGLVGQIPALFVAIAAGIIVTRVTNEESDHLGGDIGKQFLAKPYSIMVTAGLIFLLGLVPGFPTTIFMVISIIAGGVGWSVYKTASRGAWSDEGDAINSTIEDSQIKNKKAQIASPIFIDISNEVKEKILPEELNKALDIVKKEVYEDIGVPVPDIVFHLSSTLKDNKYIISIHDIPVSTGQLNPDKSFSLSDKNLFIEKGILFDPDMLFNEEGVWVNNKDLISIQKQNQNIRIMDFTQIISAHVSQLIKQNAAKFIGIQEVHSLLSTIESDYSELIKETQKVLTLPKISEVMKRLANENVPIRNLRQILEVLAERGEAEPNIIPLTELVRASLKEHISHRFSNKDNVMHVLLLHVDLEGAIQNSLRQSPAGIFLELSGDISSSMDEQISYQLKQLVPEDNVQLVIITTSQIRSFLRSHLENKFNNIPVLSQQEISTSIAINPIAELGLPE